MVDYYELRASVSDTGCSVIAYCDEMEIACAGYTESEAIQRLKDIVNNKHGMIFPDDMKNC